MKHLPCTTEKKSFYVKIHLGIMKEKKNDKAFQKKKKRWKKKKKVKNKRSNRKGKGEKKGYIKQHPDISSSILLHCLRLYEEYSLI